MLKVRRRTRVEDGQGGQLGESSTYCCEWGWFELDAQVEESYGDAPSSAATIILSIQLTLSAITFGRIGPSSIRTRLEFAWVIRCEKQRQCFAARLIVLHCDCPWHDLTSNLSPHMPRLQVKATWLSNRSALASDSSTLF